MELVLAVTVLFISKSVTALAIIILAAWVLLLFYQTKANEQASKEQ